MKATTEKAFEAYIEETLAARGWNTCSNLLWDKIQTFIPGEITAFIKDTQEKLWLQMEKFHGAELPGKIVEAVTKERDLRGTLHILRHGFKFYGKTFRLGYYKPAHGLNKEILELFGKNRLLVTRQVPCHSTDGSSVDMVLSKNWRCSTVTAGP